MPYYLHAKESAPETGIPFDDRAAAFAAMQAGCTETLDQAIERLGNSDTEPVILQLLRVRGYLYATVDDYYDRAAAVDVITEARARVCDANRQTLDQQTGKITYAASYRETCKWNDREYARFYEGTYQRVPWIGFNDRHEQHYLHISVKDPGYVAYTPDAESGVRDRQLRVRPGKYLTEFYPDAADKHQEWIHCTSPEALGLKIARTEAEITAVYKRGPSSCMRNWVDAPDGYNKHGLDTSPVVAYADSDLAIAYMGPIDNVTARAVVWPGKMRFGRAYGNDSALIAVLTMNGYEEGSMDGARIRALEVPERDSAYRMPYVDGVQNAERDGKWFILGRPGYDAQVTIGYVEDEDNSERCQRCNRYVESVSDDQLCDSCEDDRSTCELCGDRFDDDDMRSFTHANVCEHCADHHEISCDYCDTTWNDLDRRRGDRGQSRCDECQDAVTCCEYCDGEYDTREDSTCPHCDGADPDDDADDQDADAPDPVITPAVVDAIPATIDAAPASSITDAGPALLPITSLSHYGIWIVVGHNRRAWYCVDNRVYLVDIDQGSALRLIYNRDTGAPLTPYQLRANLSSDRYCAPQPFMETDVDPRPPAMRDYSPVDSINV